MAVSALPLGTTLPLLPTIDRLRDEVEHLLSESRRVGLGYLKASLDLSHTIATLPDPKRGAGFAEACYRTASRGYQAARRDCTAGRWTTTELVALDSRMDRLQSALQDLQSAEHHQDVVTRTSDASTSDPLTPREGEVLKSIAEGHSTKQVAGLLGITFKTAACHRSHIMEKLGIHDTATLVRYAIRRGLIEP